MIGRSFFGIAHDMRFFNNSRQKTNWRVIGASDYALGFSNLPIELQYALAIHPSRTEYLKSIFSSGHALAFGHYPISNPQVLKAIRCVSIYQHGAIHPWLEDLIVKNIIPVFSESDLEEATERGIDLIKQVEIIKNHVSELIQIKIVKSENIAISDEEKKMIDLLARDIQKIYAVKVTEILYGLIVLNKQDVLLLLLFGALIFGPLIHILEMIFSGLGKFTAIIFPFIFLRGIEIFSEYKNGDAWWQIKKRFKKQSLEIIIMFLGALSVELFLRIGSALMAGMVFVFSANSFIFGQAIRKFFIAKRIHFKLVSEGKLVRNHGMFRLSLFHGPLWFVVIISFLPAILFSMFLFMFAGSLISNGWLLYFTAAAYCFFTFLFSEIWLKTSAYRFKKRLKRLLRKAIII